MENVKSKSNDPVALVGDQGATPDSHEPQHPAKQNTGREALTPSINEKSIIRKLDMHIIPLVMVLYCFSFLDRYVGLRADIADSRQLTEGILE